MRRRTAAVMVVCVLGLVTFLAWPPAHNAEYYINRAWERLPGHDNTPGDPQGAIADFNRALKQNSKLAAAYAGRAVAKSVMADPGYRVSSFSYSQRERESAQKRALRDEAIADLDRAIELNPKEENYFNRRARLKYHQGDFSGMVADLARADEVMPSAQISLRHIGSSPAETAVRLLRGGLRNYDRAITEKPAFSWGYFHRGVFKHLAGDLDGALADFRRCSEFSDSKLSDYAAIHMWLVRAQKEEIVDASRELSAHFNKRTNETPPNWERQIAEFLLDRASQEDFLAVSRASEAERRRSQFWYYKAAKLLLADDNKKAAECLREALRTESRPYAVLMSAEIQLGLLNQ